MGLRLFFGTVKGEVKIKLFHYVLKYNGFLVAQNLSGNLIAFMGDRTADSSFKL